MHVKLQQKMMRSLGSYNRYMSYDVSLGSVHLKSVGGGPENEGGGGMQIPYWIWGGPSKFRIGFGGGGHVNSAYVEKSPGRYISTFLCFCTILDRNPFQVLRRRGGGGVKGEVASGSAPPAWI